MFLVNTKSLTTIVGLFLSFGCEAADLKSCYHAQIIDAVNSAWDMQHIAQQLDEKKIQALQKKLRYDSDGDSKTESVLKSGNAHLDHVCVDKAIIDTLRHQAVIRSIQDKVAQKDYKGARNIATHFFLENVEIIKHLSKRKILDSDKILAIKFLAQSRQIAK